jgi:SAM-dependent methyltransferase
MNIKKNIIKITPNFILKILYNRKKRIIDNSYRGNDVECLICKAKYKLFRPYGIVERKNAQCPNCNSLERHRLLWSYVNDKTNLINNNSRIKILHIAPERFFYNLFDNAENIDYVPCDLFPEKYGYSGTEILKIDITNISLDDNSFDFILCNHVLEHIIEDKLAISELYRVMKTGGFGIFQVPINYSLEETYEDLSIITPDQRLAAYGQSDHVRIYGSDYIDRLKNAGFKVIIDNYVKSFSKSEKFKYGFSADELIYKCQKVTS